MTRHILLSGFLLLVELIFIQQPTSGAQIQQFIELGDRVEQEIKAAKPRLVAVVDFSPADGMNPAQGHYFSLLLSSILGTREKKKFKTADHVAFDADLARLQLTPETLVPGDSLRAAAPQIGADLLIVGTYRKNGNSYLLQVTPVRTANFASLHSLTLAFESNEFFESIGSPFPSGVMSLAGHPQRTPQRATMPSCVHCPDPSYTDPARRAKINGTSMFEVLISADGDAKQIRPVKLLGYGLDEEAFAAIKKWRFRPATFQGTPVPCVVPVEVTFRLY